MGYGWGWYKPVIKEVDIIPSKEEPEIKPTINSVATKENTKDNSIDECTCRHCNRTFKSKAGRLSHERHCKEVN